MTSHDTKAEIAARRSLKGTAALTIGTAVTGLAAYGFIIVGTRALGADGFAPISVLWTLWSISVAVVTFPIQHWIIRVCAVTSGTGDEAPVRSAMPMMAVVTAGLAAIVTGITWFARGPLFHDTGAAYPLLAGLVVPGSTAMGVLRGIQVSRGRLAAAGTGIAAENLVRLGLAVLLWRAHAGAPAFGAALVAGFLVAAAWPSCFVLGTGTDQPVRSSWSTFRVLAAIAGGSVFALLILTGGPVALALAGGEPAQVTALFAASSLFRAPYLLAAGASMELTRLLTKLVVDEDANALRRFRLLLVASTAVAAGAAALAGGLLGPHVIPAMFGIDVALSDQVMALVAVANIVALATLVQTLVLVAHDRSRSVPVGWSIAAGVFVLVCALPLGDATVRVASAFLASEVVAFALLLRSDPSQRGAVRSGGAPSLAAGGPIQPPLDRGE